MVVFAARGAYGGKPRPGIVVQSDAFAMAHSVTLVPVTTTTTEVSASRVTILPTAESGLRHDSHAMADKVITVRHADVQHVIGRLSSDDMHRLDRALLVFLGLV